MAKDVGYVIETASTFVNPGTQIKIGPILYDVVEEHGLVDGEKSHKLDGHIRYSESQIMLEANLKPQSKRQTLWHEVIHGIMTQAGYKISEGMTDALAYGLMGVLQDNPWLTEKP